MKNKIDWRPQDIAAMFLVATLFFSLITSLIIGWHVTTNPDPNIKFEETTVMSFNTFLGTMLGIIGAYISGSRTKKTDEEGDDEDSRPPPLD